jgi:hypothetical protein
MFKPALRFGNIGDDAGYEVLDAQMIRAAVAPEGCAQSARHYSQEGSTIVQLVPILPRIMVGVPLRRPL